MKEFTSNKKLITTFVLLIVGFCSLMLAYEIVEAADRAVCYERLSEDMGVASTFTAIDEVFYEQLQMELKPGMDQEEVVRVLEAFAPISINWEYPNLGGGFKVFITLDVCFFHKNGFSYLVFYSDDEKFEEVRKYTED